MTFLPSGRGDLAGVTILQNNWYLFQSFYNCDMVLSSCLICARDSDHICLFFWKNFILPFVSVFSEGPCLIHSMNGDLLRTLEGPENCLKPKLIQASREGHCVIFYENGSFCTFSVNGKLQAAMETDDNIRVSVPYRLPSICASTSECVGGWGGRKSTKEASVFRHQGPLFHPRENHPVALGRMCLLPRAQPVRAARLPSLQRSHEVKPGGACRRGKLLGPGKPSWVAVSGPAHYFPVFVFLTEEC